MENAGATENRAGEEDLNDILMKPGRIMEQQLSIQEGERIVLDGEDFLVLSITDLGTEHVDLSSICQWGTHILTLKRARDGRLFAATRYASGDIGSPYPFRVAEAGD